MSGLYPHQQKGYNDLRSALQQGFKRPMYSAPTGSGKTRLSSEILGAAAARGKKSFFFCDQINLVEQAAKAFYKAGLHVGIQQGQHPGYDDTAPIQVASIQTLARRIIPRMDLGIIDEAHCLHTRHIDIMNENEGVPFIGMSATPFVKGMGLHFDTLVEGPTTAQLTEGGYLCDTVVYAPAVPDMTGVAQQAGDWQVKALDEMLGDKKIVGDIVATWFKLGENRPTLCYAPSVASSRKIAEDFMQAGVMAEHIDAHTKNRDEIMARFEAGLTKVLVSVGTMTKGFDCPMASCLICARPTKQLALWVQIVGRILRQMAGKVAIILDHSGNTIRHGLPTMSLPMILDDGSKKTREAIKKAVKEKQEEEAPARCPQCTQMNPGNVKKCQHCGHIELAYASIPTKTGDLAKKSGDFSTAVKKHWYEQLLGYEKEKGKKRGFAWHTYQRKFREKPNFICQPVECSDQAVRSFVKSCFIRHAKRRAA